MFLVNIIIFDYYPNNLSPKKNLKLSAVWLSKPCEASPASRRPRARPSNRPPPFRIFAGDFLAAAGGEMRRAP
ncbi:hypothetical protein A2643_00240 [Candidatus Nomurabacteria bacterium RIFCSPHIGHO2_01_FULL_39_220]|nr:MAG: hypothetical protein A2643_00240 [Candidatus Nomurabacteria bacterium RIFCSPHIGHO2_01_FULL_39_220]OGI81572.1 MAG: hypothetical protein A3E03_01535 [Candidatus Nomurabacteria bacterium RIFCSPHIGHO2_12_FULL_40_64]